MDTKMMKSPIIIAENMDISVHPNSKHAETFLEPNDIKDGLYVGFDSNGNLLDLDVILVENQHKFLFFNWNCAKEVIKIQLHQPVENRKDELRWRLLKYLEWGKEKENLSHLSTAELIQLVCKMMPWKLE
jgi:hypothetical protein